MQIKPHRYEYNQKTNKNGPPLHTLAKKTELPQGYSKTQTYKHPSKPQTR
jgi:hypothetical protein